MSKEKISHFQELKRSFNKAGLNPYQGGSQNPRPKCAVFDEIGQLALQGDQDALEFLINNMSNDDCFIRYAVMGFLGDMPTKNFKKADINAEQLLSLTVDSEKDKKILDLAQRSLNKIKNK